MLEEKDEQLHQNVEETQNSETTVEQKVTEKSTEEIEIPTTEDADTIPAEASADGNEPSQIATESITDGEKKSEEDVHEEIDESNAEDAEDEDNHHRHHIPLLDYHSMSMENLVGELQKLVRNEKIQAIKKHVDGIKSEFDLKFQEFLEHKKEEFVANGGNEIDFRYNSVTKRQFNEVFGEYREKRDQYYKNLEQNLKTNLTKRLAIIEELKSLVNVEEDINTTLSLIHI